MAVGKPSVAIDYVIVLRLIQPARIQDIVRMYPKILGGVMSGELAKDIEQIHRKMRQDNRLISVRRGTFILDQQGMSIAARMIKERNLDNARIFLMKNQRKSYHKLARWLG